MTLDLRGISRRRFVGIAAGAGAVAYGASFRSVFAQGTAPQSGSMIDQMRAAAASAKIQTQPLRNGVQLLMGSGGNIVVLPGKDGKLVVDSGFSSSQPQITLALAAISADPLKHLVNTHWHFDHVDGNEWMHKAGATITSDERTRARMSEHHSIPIFKLEVPPSPKDALPTDVFPKDKKMEVSGETIHLKSYAPAHTDTDISVHFAKANVLHAGDTFFNGFYPFIDYDTGGNIKGMVAAAKVTLALTNADTMIVPGHGPLGTRAQLQEYHDMLAGSLDKVAALKKAGKSEDEAVAAKASADFDEKWGKGRLNPEMWTRLVYKGA
jgi:glyoxylase-like metal-dependent hydrolase (beta-lactamase superfamily II)